jgi:hypothetical protein
MERAIELGLVDRADLSANKEIRGRDL